MSGTQDAPTNKASTPMQQKVQFSTQAQDTSPPIPQAALSMKPLEDKPLNVAPRSKSNWQPGKLIVGITIAGMIAGTAFAIGGSWSNTFLIICASASVIVGLIQIDKRR